MDLHAITARGAVLVAQVIVGSRIRTKSTLLAVMMSVRGSMKLSWWYSQAGR
jgi:hypothetical protein